jgi:hypothetical protein
MKLVRGLGRWRRVISEDLRYLLERVEREGQGLGGWC